VKNGSRRAGLPEHAADVLTMMTQEITRRRQRRLTEAETGTHGITTANAAAPLMSWGPDLFAAPQYGVRPLPLYLVDLFAVK